MIYAFNRKDVWPLFQDTKNKPHISKDKISRLLNEMSFEKLENLMKPKNMDEFLNKVLGHQNRIDATKSKEEDITPV